MNRLKTIARAVQRELAGAQIPAFAANAAFFLFLSVFPALLFLLSVTQYTTVSMDGILNFLSPIVPDALEPLVTAILSDLSRSNSAGILSLSTVFLLWSASKGVYGLVRGLNQALRVRRPGRICSSGPVRALYRRRAGDFAHHRHALYRQPELLSKILLPGSVLYRLLSTLLHYRWFVAGVVLAGRLQRQLSRLSLPAQHTAPGAAGEPCRQLRLGHLLRAVLPLCKALRRVVHLRQHLHRRLHHALALFLYVYLLLRCDLKSIRACVKKRS